MSNRNIILDGETADRICCETVKQHIGYITKDIAAAKKAKPISEAQATELGYNISLLESLKVVYNYYGGKS